MLPLAAIIMQFALKRDDRDFEVLLPLLQLLYLTLQLVVVDKSALKLLLCSLKITLLLQH